MTDQVLHPCKTTVTTLVLRILIFALEITDGRIDDSGPSCSKDIIIIIIIIYCNWVVTRWQWLFYMYTKYEIVTNKFKSGGLHERHVVATWNVGNHLSICL